MADPPVSRDGKLNMLNKKIIEVKKKIQLSEGQRKANFEECDATKRENSEKISRLKKEVKQLQMEFAKAKKVLHIIKSAFDKCVWKKNWIIAFRQTQQVVRGDLKYRMAIHSQQAAPSEFPYLVSIQVNHGHHHCGGSLISRRSVLTAAHCIPQEVVYNIPTFRTYWAVEVGSVVIGHGRTHGISGGWIHPGFEYLRHEASINPTDIGVITLSTPVVLSSHVSIISLPESNARVPVGGMSTAAGFGSAKSGFPMSRVLRKSNLIITSLEECNWFYQRNTGRRIKATQICAKLDPGHGTCYEDNSPEHQALINDALPKNAKKGLQESAALIDDDIINLRKRLDLLRYHTDKQRRRLTLLLHEYKQLMNGKPIKISFNKPSNSFLKKKIIKLENQLHRVGMLQMEAFTVGKKYRSIKSCLKSDAVFYASCLDDLEKNIQEQETEIKRLEDVKKEAIKLRDTTRETLAEHETQALYKTKERDGIIQDYRRRVEERKLDLERLSRVMFSTAKSASHDELDSSRGTGRKTPRDPQRDELPEAEVDKLEEMFAKLRDATGVSRTEDVLERFVAQQDTKNKLKKLQLSTEQEKVELEKTRQELATEIEMHRFSETKEADQNAEKLEKINQDIEDQRLRQTDAQVKFNELETLLQDIGQKLEFYCAKFKAESEMDMRHEQHTTIGPTAVLSQLEECVTNFIDMVGGSEKFAKLLESIAIDKQIEGTLETSSELTKHTALEDRPLFPLFPTVTTPAAQAQPSEDEEDIPTRNVLKRQAQLLVDAKSRRKGFVFRR